MNTAVLAAVWTNFDPGPDRQGPDFAEEAFFESAADHADRAHVVRIGPKREALVDFNMLSDDRDLDRLVAAVQKTFAWLDTPTIRAVRNEVVWPGPALIKRLSRPGWASWMVSAALNAALGGPAALRRRLFKGIELDCAEMARDTERVRKLVLGATVPSGHTGGTCRMGAADDPAAVVDPRCRVIGVSGLRVADASIMPTIIVANTNIPANMIGEKAAAIILEDADNHGGGNWLHQQHRGT